MESKNFRQRDNTDAWRAGIYSVLVHALLLGALLISFNWKTTHPISVAQVELWDNVPAKISPSVPAHTPIPPVVEKKFPVLESKPKTMPALKSESQVEIAIKEKPLEKKVEKPIRKELPKPDTKAEDVRKKIFEQLRQEDLKPAPKVNAPASNDALKKMQQEMLDEAQTVGEQKSAASAGVVDEYKAKIQAKIRSNVNKTLCGNGNPELKFEIGLIPGGELSGAPKLVKSSGNAACDDAVERAIRMSEPLPLPPDSSLFSQFRNLKLTFRPNDR